MPNPPMPVIDRDLNERPFSHILVKVTTGNDFSLSDMYDGVTYLFEPNKEQKMPAEAAHHIFGWTETASHKEVYSHVQRRWGWNTPQWSDKAPRFWDKFKIVHATFKLVEVSEEELGTPTPEDEQLGARGTRRA